MARWFRNLGLLLSTFFAAALARPLVAQATRDSTVCTGCVPVVVQVPDSVQVWSYFTRPDTTYRDSVVQVPIVVPPPAPSRPHEPAGFTPIVEISFGAQKLPAGPTGPSAVYGVERGKVTSAEQSARVIPGRTGQPGDYAHRCVFPKNTSNQAGKGVGCTFTAKEDLPGNTDGNTVHSYRRYYESGWFRFANVDAAGVLQPVFEEPSPGGMKLLGYWGVGFSGNSYPLQLIGWWAPVPRGSAGMGVGIATWTFQLSSQNTGVLVWDKYSTAPVAAGNLWHPYEILFDAGDPNQSNGTAEVWIDGVRVLSASGLAFRATAAANGGTLVRGFLGRHWNPVQGGGCQGTSCGRASAGVLDVDDLYISVSQPVD
jgi:hypothetical protein